MEQFATEEQQVEAIKKFWKDNGAAIVIGAVLGLGGLWGWRYYGEQQVANMEKASTEYELVTTSVGVDDATDVKVAEFISANKESGYSVLAALQLSKASIDAENFEEAIQHLDFVASNASEVSIKDIANLRLARIYLQQDKLDAAMKAAEAVSSESFGAQVQELKGDIYLAQSLTDKARAAYSAALEDNAGNYLLKMKLDNLASING
ncbi:tetratricopeptide repeat protein [Aestuariibacter sp. AA17]|uniref:Ancillary SecYEG translocon subunit n=1 Tax=Fluctibacter corallii TaxID=2984329 RepID=A0ABT3A401_9ALTE|nr:tetratricopeptide repeat protein [Aestuariibacter sp. AA17]MCV2883126.1 tetratricopeptide repeat protein [Aestuariibacter sp. AA17]